MKLTAIYDWSIYNHEDEDTWGKGEESATDCCRICSEAQIVKTPASARFLLIRSINATLLSPTRMGKRLREW